MFNHCFVNFLGYVVYGVRFRADPDKVSAVQNMDAPQCVADTQGFTGIINQLLIFPRISKISQSL